MVYPVIRERSRARAIDHLYKFVMSYAHIEEMAVEDGAAPDAEILVKRLSAKFPEERIYRSKTSPAIGAHTGPHILIVTVLGDKE